MIQVVAALIRKDGLILITRRFDHVHLPGLWEFPGGKVEKGETLESALKREILEELGVEITVFDEFFDIEHRYPSKTVHLHFFNCIIQSEEPRAVEVADLKWVSPAELDGYPFPEADRKLIARLKGS